MILGLCPKPSFAAKLHRSSAIPLTSYGLAILRPVPHGLRYRLMAMILGLCPQSFYAL